MTGRAERTRHPRRAIVGTAVCALLLAAFGTVFGVHRHNTELRNDCAAAVSSADQAVDDYVSAVTATEPVLRSADDTSGYKDSEGASALVDAVAGADRQVRMDLTCTDRGQLEALRNATAELGTKKDALVTDTLHLTVSISSYNNAKAAGELSAVIQAAQSVYDGSAGQLPDDGVRSELRTEIDEATALLDAAADAREQAAGSNDPAPVDESTKAMGAKRIELSTKKDDTAKAAGIASEQAAEQQAQTQESKPDQPTGGTPAPEENNPGNPTGGSGGSNSGGAADNGGGGSKLDNPGSGGGPTTSDGSGSHGSHHESDDDDDDDDDDEEDSHRNWPYGGGNCGWVWVNQPYYDWWGWHPGYWSWRCW